MSFVFFFLMIRRPSRTTRPYTLFPYSSLVRSTARIGDERIAVIARLAIGEAEHALFAQRVAAIAGQDVEQVVRVAQAVRIQLHLVVELLPAHLVAFGDEARGRQDRKRVVSGKSVSIRVDRGGCRVIKKKKK